MNTFLFPQAVQAGIMGRTVLRCAPVGKEGSATQLLESVSVPLVGWDSPASKVTSWQPSPTVVVYEAMQTNILSTVNAAGWNLSIMEFDTEIVLRQEYITSQQIIRESIVKLWVKLVKNIKLWSFIVCPSPQRACHASVGSAGPNELFRNSRP